MPLYTQIRGRRAMASELGSRNVIISKTVYAYICVCVGKPSDDFFVCCRDEYYIKF